MKERIIENINSPDHLERLYRENKQDFARAFGELSPDYDSELVRFWKVRLAPETESVVTGFLKLDLLVVIFLSLVSGLLVKLPDMFPQIGRETFYMRDLALIVFNGIILYTFWINKIYEKRRILIYGLTLLILALCINLLPIKTDTLKVSDSVTLAFIHVPLFMWCLFGLVYASFKIKNTDKWIEFIRINGELLIMTGLILIAGGMLTGITVALFSAIKMNIQEFYTHYVVVFGGVAAPIVSFYIIRIYPSITSKIAPVIARVFTPLVLITLVVYIISLVFSDNSILENRDLLLVFNIMLVAVMAIIVFSVTELDKSKERNVNVLILFLLAVLAIVTNAIALVAIISRLSNGLTPNRTVVLISNILIFINLILLAKSLYQCYAKGKILDNVERVVADYLKIYALWTIVVIFILPFVFGLK